MAELIDREATYEVLTSFYHHKTDIQHNALREALNKVPSVQPNLQPTCNQLATDYISRQAAIDTVRSYYDECDEREESIEERIEQLPSADIDLSDFSDKLWRAAYERGKAEVVRCKGCKHYRDYGCQRAFVYPKPDDFCSYGERADG